MSSQVAVARPVPPPKAPASRTPAPIKIRPRLWNPTAAANWSVLFTPLFGSLIFARNWKSMAQPQRAKRAMIWAYVSMAHLTLCLFTTPLIGHRGGLHILGLILLISWYLAEVRSHIAFVRDNAKDYAKRKWTKPLLVGFGALVGYGILGAMLTALAQPSQLSSPSSEVDAGASWPASFFGVRTEPVNVGQNSAEYWNRLVAIDQMPMFCTPEMMAQIAANIEAISTKGVDGDLVAHAQARAGLYRAYAVAQSNNNLPVCMALAGELARPSGRARVQGLLTQRYGLTWN